MQEIMCSIASGFHYHLSANYCLYLGSHITSSRFVALIHKKFNSHIIAVAGGMHI